MAGPRVRDKWRPTLAMIVFAVLLTVLALPAAIVIGFRALDGTASQMGPVEFGALGAALLLTLVIAVVFSRTITGPIEALIARTHEIGRGGRAAIRPPEQQGTREIAVLSQSFLDLAERLVDRTEYVRSFAAHVSHELKSPLTAIRGSAELLKHAKMNAAERAKFLDNIIKDSDRLAALLERLRELARAENPIEGGNTTLAQIAETLRVRQPGLRIDVAGDAAIAIPVDVAAIVFGHLADNALQHGSSVLHLSTATFEAGMRILIADDGAGISEGNRGKVFEPFFTTRREDGGTGMGLEIVRSLLEAHGAGIVVVPSKQGAAFEIAVRAGNSAGNQGT